MEWFGFWIFLAVVYAVDAQLISMGYNATVMWHKTPEEKRLREAVIRKAEEGLAVTTGPTI